MDQAGALQRKLLLAPRQGLSYISDTYHDISRRGWKWTEPLIKTVFTVFCSMFLRQMSLTSVFAHKCRFSRAPTRISSDNSRVPLHLAEIYVVLMNLKTCIKKGFIFFPCAAEALLPSLSTSPIMLKAVRLTHTSSRLFLQVRLLRKFGIYSSALYSASIFLEGDLLCWCHGLYFQTFWSSTLFARISSPQWSSELLYLLLNLNSFSVPALSTTNLFISLT